MTVTAVQITRRPAPTSTTPVFASRAAEPTSIVIIADVEALTRTNQPGCGDDNPYR
ncbi:hypothetical protein OHA72_07215 [Dactylosporangium sp. NBC_01737]|uniref:hypothetical protein n=1 Tax=Dactylosporangium sp. NBC_01737 TaxID=2975959 RepID=UPI002E0E688E|nr:hypothetical protein OHA72_07215 [Dactylosporangium sp. NBC_01737]